MKQSRMIVACVAALIASPAALAADVEGTANTEQQTMQQPMQPSIETAIQGGAEESIYGLLAAQQQRFAAEQKGVAGRAGNEMGMMSPKSDRGSGEGNLYDQIRIDYH